jgi:sugar lactone lactonase YvrE
MKSLNKAAALALVLSAAAMPSLAQSVYTTPYAFTNFARQPGLRGTNNGTGSAARFDIGSGSGLAVDNAGNVCVGDTQNSMVRKITAAAVVTTLAGAAGRTGTNDATGSAARFYHPGGVAVDGAGNVYVGDNGNSTVRKVTPAGAVTTLAGSAGKSGSADGTGSAAGFGSSLGIAVDGATNVYVADAFNHTIRRISLAAVVTTLAGLAGQAGATYGTNDAARFNLPFAIAVDTATNLYVAEYGNNTIRKITPSGTNWIVTTLAGVAGHAGTNDATGTAAHFGSPQGVVVDGAGNVFVADWANVTIRKITPDGVVTTVAGQVGQLGSADGVGSAARFSSCT